VNHDVVLNWPFEPIEQSYDERDSMLYALGLGIGADPIDPGQLKYVYEDGLTALPTMAVTLGYPGLYLRDPAAEVDWKQLLHGEQSLVVHRPLGPSGQIVSKNRVDAIVDKGPGRGALVYSTREQYDAKTGEPVATLASTAVCRADGGFGGPVGPVKQSHPIPEGDPDDVVEMTTLPQLALIYRLCGDRNPIHADPQVAREAGFDRPILHGLCTFGIAGWALVKTVCDGRPGRLRRLDVRFSAPVFPGDTISTSVWRERDGHAAFRCSVDARGVIVLDNGYAEWRA
jgi:acyl dehydratase